MAVICHDEHPVPLAQDDDRRRKYPLITNANVLLKNEFRASLNDRFPQAGHERLLLHATDTALEAQQHLQAVYGNDYPTVCRQLVHMIG